MVPLSQSVEAFEVKVSGYFTWNTTTNTDLGTYPDVDIIFGNSREYLLNSVSRNVRTQINYTLSNDYPPGSYEWHIECYGWGLDIIEDERLISLF